MTAVVPASFFESFSKRVKRNKASPICLLASEFHKQQAGRRYVDRNQDHEGPAIPPKMDHWIGNLQGASDTLEKFPVQEKIDVVSLSQFYFVQLHGLNYSKYYKERQSECWLEICIFRAKEKEMETEMLPQKRTGIPIHSCFRQTYVLFLFSSLCFNVFFHAHLGYPLEFPSIPRLG